MSDADRNSEDKLDDALERMRSTVIAAIDQAYDAFAEAMSTAGTSEPPPPRQYFASCVMQLAYCLQCGADIKRFHGGDPKLAWHAIKNAIDISNHYWGSKFELQQK